MQWQDTINLLLYDPTEVQDTCGEDQNDILTVKGAQSNGIKVFLCPLPHKLSIFERIFQKMPAVLYYEGEWGKNVTT